MEEIIDIEEDDFILALCCEDELLFALLFWEDVLDLETSLEQKLMFLDRSKQVLVCTGRKIAKTVAIEAKVVQLGINHIQRGTGITEALLFAPQDNQLSPIVDRVASRISRTPFFDALCDDVKRGEGQKISFVSGLVWYCRIEGVSGTDRNMVGLRAAFILGDEMAFGNDINHNSRIQTALPNARWWYSGVPNGVRTTPFYRLDQTALGKSWSRHKYSTFVNPMYQDDERKATLIDAYGGEHTQGYITQVLGEWGDETISSFPPGAISIGHQPYFIKEFTSTLKNSDAAIAAAIGIGSIRADRFAIGWDYGYSPDPSVLLIAYQRDSSTDWFCYAKIVMRQVTLPVQARVVKYIYKNILQGNLGAISCDSADAIQTIQGNDADMADRFFAVKPGGLMPMIDEEGKPVMQVNEDTQKLEVVLIRVKQYLTEKFRGYMINKLLDLPGIKITLGNDTEMIEELAATTESKTMAGYTVYYGPPDPGSSGKMKDHDTDAGRHLTDAIIRSVDKESESDLELISVMGWAGKGDSGWVAPW